MSTQQITHPPRSATESAIEAVALVKTYGRVRALDGVSFTVRAGTVFGLLGPNGAGKSTTVKVLTTLSAPDSGEATVAGLDVRRQPDQIRRTIGYVSQKPSFDPVGTGRENLVLQGRIHGMRGRRAGQRADELLDRFGLADAAGRRAGTWSGGMQRKLDVAMGLMHAPQVLFLDEPTTGLDPQARLEMWAEIGTLAQRDGVTVLLTTHYLDEADHLADQLVIIDRGRVVASGSPDDLKNELGGDRIQVELARPDQAGEARRAIAAATGQDGITADGTTLRARVAGDGSGLPRVLAALDDAGVEIAAVSLARPSLDDVYLHHAGRDFREADTSGGRA